MPRLRPIWKALGRDNTIQDGFAPDGEEGVELIGHRAFVGGNWEETGRLQLDFLVAQGLRPHHVLADIACGALRGGVHFIDHLEPGNYLGIEKQARLVEAGVRDELAPGTLEVKRPELVVSGDFAFDRFSKGPDFALAQSLFSHLPPPLIRLCLRRLAEVARPGCRFFATFNETPRRLLNPPEPHAHHFFAYTRGQMAGFARRTPWDCHYVGDWNHPRGQKMVEYRLR